MDNRTEKMRSSLFNEENQNAWAIESIQVENTIQKMFENSDQPDLIAIYDYARNNRSRIAYEHDTLGKKDFGKTRTERQTDLYIPNQFAGGEPNLPALNNMKNILLAQDELIKNPLIKPANLYLLHQAFPDSDVEQYIIWRDAHAKTRTLKDLMENVAVRMTIAKKNTLESESTVIRDSLEITQIEVLWGEMNPALYAKKLKELNYLLSELKNPSCTGIIALKTLGLLAHELSNLVPLTRGSAGVNGWIIRGLAKAKGFDLGVMKVLDLPYDVCAMIYKNKDHYAEQFTESMIKSFNLNIDVHFEDTRRLTRDFLIQSLDQLDSFAVEHSSNPSLSLINSLKDTFIRLEQKINYLKLNIDLSTVAKIIQTTLAKIPSDNLSRVALNQLINEIHNITKIEVLRGYHQNSFFHLPQRFDASQKLIHLLLTGIQKNKNDPEQLEAANKMVAQLKGDTGVHNKFNDKDYSAFDRGWLKDLISEHPEIVATSMNSDEFKQRHK